MHFSSLPPPTFSLKEEKKESLKFLMFVFLSFLILEELSEFLHYWYTILCRILKVNAQVRILSPVDINIGHCIGLTFFEGKLNGFLVRSV